MTFEGNLVASWHSYDFNYCVQTQCWESNVAPVSKQVPVITGEIGMSLNYHIDVVKFRFDMTVTLNCLSSFVDCEGEGDCTPNYINRLMPWLDAHNISYLAWTWNVWDCKTLITNYNGATTAFGAGYKQHISQL
jgi:hypothetical protein